MSQQDLENPLTEGELYLKYLEEEESNMDFNEWAIDFLLKLTDEK